MATTGANGVAVIGSTAVLNGSTVAAPPFISAQGPVGASDILSGTSSTCIDRVLFDASLTSRSVPSGQAILPIGDSVGGFALNGWGVITLVTTGTADIDLTDITLAADARFVTGGDTVFAKVGCIVLKNYSSTVLTLKPGASNPASLPVFAGTTPTIAIPAAVAGVPGKLCIDSPTLVTVDGTHKILTVTPTAGGVLKFWIGGA